MKSDQLRALACVLLLVMAALDVVAVNGEPTAHDGSRLRQAHIEVTRPELAGVPLESTDPMAAMVVVSVAVALVTAIGRGRPSLLATLAVALILLTADLLVFAHQLKTSRPGLVMAAGLAGSGRGLVCAFMLWALRLERSRPPGPRSGP